MERPKRSLRIGQICPYSLSVPGGVQGQVLALARTLRSMGHETRVLAPCDGPPPEPMVTALGKSVPTASNGSLAPIAPDPACALRTIHALRNERFDVLHIHEPLVPGPSLTSLVVTDVPVVATFHASGSRTAYSYLPWATRRAAKKIAVRVAVSEDAQTTAEASLKGRYELLYNGIEMDRFAHAEPWPKQGRTVFFVGRHEPRKGLGLLIDAMAALPEDARLWIAGTGPQTASLQAVTADDPRVEWLGRISDEEKVSRLRAADVFCAPSTEGESFGIVLLEAMTAGAPVVASALSGYEKVSRGGHDARLFPPSNVPALTAALHEVLSDKSVADRLRANGKARAEMFSMQSLADAYVDTYLRATNKLSLPA